MRLRLSTWRRLRALGLLLVPLVFMGCYQGGEREKEPPPGYPGGFCLAPNGTCHVGVCDLMNGAYCYDPGDPCHGVFCGGLDENGNKKGECLINSDGKPTCQCYEPYSNEEYSLFCQAAGATTGDPPTGDDTGGDAGPLDVGG